jgi:subtilisin family serine protease
VIAVDATQQVTIVLSASTEVRKFGNRLPTPGDWLEAEGNRLSDGRVEARKVRPDAFEANQVVVRLKATNDPAGLVQELASSYNMTVSAVLPSANIFLLTTQDDEETEVGRLLNDPRVDWAEINWVSRAPTGDPYRTWKWGTAEESGYANQHAFEQVNLTPALANATGAGVTVAILDTGLDLEHPVFAGMAAASQLTLLANSNMISDTGAPDDTGPGLAWGHGTHVAGVLHAAAPGARLMPIRILDSQGRGNTFVLAYAIELALANGADVINLSLGADCGSRVLAEAVQSAMAQGVVIVAAAGNDASATPQCPARLPGVLAVAAVDENRQRAVWSNYGETWVDLAAPGVGITSTFPVGLGAETGATPGYAAWSGTSMATPFVAGAAALVVEQQSRVPGELTVAETLVKYGDDISALNPAPYVVGRHLNIAAAVNGLPTEPEPSAFSLYLPAVAR